MDKCSLLSEIILMNILGLFYGLQVESSCDQFTQLEIKKNLKYRNPPFTPPHTSHKGPDTTTKAQTPSHLTLRLTFLS